MLGQRSGYGGMRVKRRVVSASAFLMVLLVSAFAAGESIAGDEYEAGDSWTYDMEMTIESLQLSGTYTQTFDGESTQTVAGYTYSTYEIGYHGSLTITGTMLGYTVSGTATVSGVDSVDQNSLNVVVGDYEISMEYSVVIGSTPVTMEYSEHNISKISPPGGVGEEPEHPDEGTSWTKTYTVHSETTINDDGDISTESSSFTARETYTYMGVQTITVPAGTFECEVIQTDDGESISTGWYCDDTGTYVKSAYETGSSQTATRLLKSYSYTPPSSGGLSSAMMLMIAGIAVVVVVAVVVAWVLLRRKSPPMEQQVSPTVQQPGPPMPPAG